MISHEEALGLIGYNREVYNAIAQPFSKTRQLPSHEMLRASAFIQDKSTVIDLGCGNGRLYQVLAKKQVNYIGIDHSEALIEIAKHTYPNQRFFVRDIASTLLQERIADVVCAFSVLHHFPNQETRVKALTEMKRQVKQGGKIVLTNWNLYNNWARAKYSVYGPDEFGDFYLPWRNERGRILGIRYFHGFLLEELHDLAKAAGLVIEEQYYLHNGEVDSMGTGEMIYTVMTT